MKRNKWTKPATILLAAVCIFLAALGGGAVAPKDQWLLQVDGVPISREEYLYFLSEALRDPLYSTGARDGKPADMAALRKDTAQRCVAYVAVQTELSTMRRALGPQYKQEAANSTAGLWRIFGAYYRRIGVSKETLLKMETYRAAERQLFEAWYDGKTARWGVPETEIEAYFDDHYVAYNGIRVFLTETAEDGSEVPLTKLEMDSLRNKLSELAAEVNSGTAFLTAAQHYGEVLGYGSPASAVIELGGPEIPPGGFVRLKQLDPKKASVLEFDKFFLVAMGIDMKAGRDEYYLRYRNLCLRDLRQEQFDQTMAAMCATYGADENVGAVERLLREFPWETQTISDAPSMVPTTAAPPKSTTKAAAAAVKPAASAAVTKAS
ncbi:MAG: hypothetical protein LBJ11_10705 [Oscillospiraceae bacterium]|jgi:hypothetical protein|nr:hypothetical protein [Oscillospiraceae bacterium]